MTLIITLLLKTDSAFVEPNVLDIVHNNRPLVPVQSPISPGHILTVDYLISILILSSHLCLHLSNVNVSAIKFCITCTSLYMLLLSYLSSLYPLFYDVGKLRRAPCCAVSAYLLLGLEPNEYKPH